MPLRPTNDELYRYADGESVPAVDAWLNPDAVAHDTTSLALPAAIPVKIGEYVVKRELGRGAMGVVFLATDPDLDRDVAIKVIHPQLLAEKEYRDRFVKEGKLLASVANCDNVVKVYDAGECDGRHYLVTEFVDGIDFTQWLAANEGRITAEDVLWASEHVLSGLVTIHKAGLIHRDLKPSNLCVARAKVTIIDFGVATKFDRHTLTTAGTTAYMAPEVLAGGDAIKDSDIYAAGVLLYEMVTGKLVGVLEDPTSESKFQELPPSLRRFILKLLEKEPSKRLTAEAALAELEAIRKRKPATNPWLWLTLGVSATLGLIVAGAFLIRVEQARTVERLRATEVELNRQLDELSEAVKELHAAHATHLLLGKADAVALQKAVIQFEQALNRYNAAKTRIDAAYRTRAELLSRLDFSATH